MCRYRLLGHFTAPSQRLKLYPQLFNYCSAVILSCLISIVHDYNYTGIVPLHILMMLYYDAQTKRTTELCSTRWKSLRDKFVKELRKVKARKSGDKGPPYVSPWKLYRALTFLTDSVKHRQ